MTTTTPRVVASGKLIRLREKHVDDARRDYSWRRDPELAAYDAARPLTLSFRSFVATLSDDLRSPSAHRRSLAIEDLATGRHIGNVMFYGYDSTLREAELGITIGDREFWSRGFGTDAVVTMLHYLFEQRDLARVYLHTLTWNHRARAAFARAGFHRIRTVQRDGHEFELMEIRREDFLSGEAPAV